MLGFGDYLEGRLAGLERDGLDRERVRRARALIDGQRRWAGGGDQ
jgi:hypothetical protein